MILSGSRLRTDELPVKGRISKGASLFLGVAEPTNFRYDIFELENARWTLHRPTGREAPPKR